MGSKLRVSERLTFLARKLQAPELPGWTIPRKFHAAKYIGVLQYLVMHFLAATQHHGYLGWARRPFFTESSKVILCYENVLKYFALQANDLPSIEDHGCRLMVSLFNGT